MTRVNTLKDIEALYEESVLVDSNELITENEKVGKHTADSELENEKKVSKTPAKNTGPEAAENFEKAVVEAGGTGKRDEKNHYSAGKTSNESINTQVMKNKKSIFDKLYEDVLGGDDDELDMDSDFEDAMGDEEGEDEMEDEVTLSLPRELAEQLMSALEGQLGGEEDIEDIEDTEDDLGDMSGEDEFFQEGPEIAEVGDAGPTGGDLDKGNLKGKNNKVSGSGPAHKSGGKGHGQGKIKQGDGKPSELGDRSAHLTGKNNKVGGKIRGKGQELFD